MDMAISVPISRLVRAREEYGKRIFFLTRYGCFKQVIMVLRSECGRKECGFELRFWSLAMITKFVTNPPRLHLEGFDLWNSSDRIFPNDAAVIYS